MKNRLRFLYLTTTQIDILIRWSKACHPHGIIGKATSILLDNLILYLFGAEVCSASLEVKKLIVGHSTGVVLGGNGIRCTGTLHISSGVVFARRYSTPQDQSLEDKPFFDIDGDLTVGANSVLLGPLKVKGPVVIGAMSLVTHDIDTPGVYVGIPAKRIN